MLQGLYQSCYLDVKLIAYEAAKAAAASTHAWDMMSQDAWGQGAAVQLFTKPPVRLGPDGNYYVCNRLRQVRCVAAVSHSIRTFVHVSACAAYDSYSCRHVKEYKSSSYPLLML